MNFNLKDGKPLEWKDLFTDIEQLKALVEMKFREVRNLPEGSNLNELGFFWDDPFELPQNFELQAEGILFWYNPYEIASYAEGPTDFTLSHEQLKEIFKREVVF